MQLQYIYNFWHLFCQTFDIVSCAVYGMRDVLWSILIVHYNTMKSAIDFLHGLYYNMSYVLSISSEVIMCIVHGVIEFLIEVGNCLSSLVTFIWRLIILLYHIVSVVVTALENLISLLWTGSLGTVTMMSTSIEVLKESWTCTWHKGETFINKLFVLIIGGFETIGSVFIELVVAAFNILVYSFIGIPRGILYACDFCIDFITDAMNRLEGKFYSFSKESFLGLSMCILLLAMFFNSVQIMNFLDSRGMTFPFFRPRRTRDRTPPSRNAFDGGGYNFEFSDNEPMEDDGEEEDDDNYDAEEDRMTGTTNHSDNNSNHDSETESLGASSSSISSEETSESDIEIQLPSSSNRSNPSSRSPTPVPTKTTDNNEYVEKEIERERDKRKCVVCQDRMKTVLILPCRHMCLCVPCAEHIVQISSAYRRLCPLCRVRIEKVMNVYV